MHLAETLALSLLVLLFALWPIALWRVCSQEFHEVFSAKDFTKDYTDGYNRRDGP